MALWNTSQLFIKITNSLALKNFARAASSAPSVYDKIIDITVIDKQGKRHALRGLEGQSLVEVLQNHVDTLGDDVIAPSPEGSGIVDAHVKVPNELLERTALHGDDLRYLADVAEPSSVDIHSRLASKIILDRSLKGLLVALSDNYPWKTL